MTIQPAHLRAIQNSADVINLLGQLAYTASAVPIDLGEFGIAGTTEPQLLRRGSRRREGYAVLVASTDRPPRSMLPWAKAIRTHVHDRSLSLIGVTDGAGRWKRMVVLRPRIGGSGISVAKLDIDLARPTRHDANTLNDLAWRPAAEDRANQDRLDKAMDVEEVTKRFYIGLRVHYDALRDAVAAVMDSAPEVRDRLKRLGSDPAERAALRILTQVLFVQFLQRKGFVEGHTDWMSRSWLAKDGPYYTTVLERLFYGTLGTPADLRERDAIQAPFLNGGLFDRFYGDFSVDLPDELFDIDEGLLGYLDRWTFTIAEDMPDEAEVAVDPEMLGKIFEHLAGPEAVEKHGTVYTPRPVVHFMCREALVPWLIAVTALSEAEARTLLTDPDPFHVDVLGRSKTAPERDELAELLPAALDKLRVLDPAVGSGAFPLGLLSELVRLKTLCHRHLAGTDPDVEVIYGWKEHAIQHVLYGVDIEPRAIELCRLRYWLSLLVDLPPGVEPHPLPNLEYRTVVADSLVDVVNGVELQNTRGGLSFFENRELVELHREWFAAVGAHKDQIRSRIQRVENDQVEQLLANAADSARLRLRDDPAALHVELDRIAELGSRFSSADREFPCFVPALHAPEIAGSHGWDIVIMNPPYVGAKEVKQRLDASKQRDLIAHYGALNDLMILFAERALQFVRPGGVVSMIFNDSITTSAAGNAIRRRWSIDNTLLALARTKCFEGKAITGGVVVVRNQRPPDAHTVTWAEGFQKNVNDFADASDPRHLRESRRGKPSSAGEIEIWRTPSDDYLVLPHRPQFRPSPPALSLLDRYRKVKSWDSPGGWSSWDATSRTGWTSLSNTRGLANTVAGLRRIGWYDQLKPGEWTLLGLVISGGQGLATADDRRFLAVVDGTAEAAEVRARQVDYERRTLDHAQAADLYRATLAHGREAALLAVWDQFGAALGWPRIGLIRLAVPADVRRTQPSTAEQQNGIAIGPHFVPYEKGDSSDDGDSGQAIGARWVRENNVAIDWSTEAVAMLRARARHGGARSPRIQNEQNWFNDGVTWNRVASYLRCRLVPANSIFSSESPTIRPTVPWLPAAGLLALLNSDTLDFLQRTLLSSRNHMEIGDLRRVPVPVLTDDQSATLANLGHEAVLSKQGTGERPLRAVESDLNRRVRAIYGLGADDNLWVVR